MGFLPNPSHMINDMSTLMGHFVPSPRERENRDRRDSGEIRQIEKTKGKENDSRKTEEIHTCPLPLPAAITATQDKQELSIQAPTPNPLSM